jgi:hypothetical protein
MLEKMSEGWWPRSSGQFDGKSLAKSSSQFNASRTPRDSSHNDFALDEAGILGA